MQEISKYNLQQFLAFIYSTKIYFLDLFIITF